MKRNLRIKVLLLIAILWIVGIFAVQIYSLPQIREQVAAGLRTGLLEISRDVAQKLSRVYEKNLTSDLLRLIPDDRMGIRNLAERGVAWTDLIERAEITNAWAIALPDSSTQSWDIRQFIPEDQQGKAAWKATTALTSRLQVKLPQSYGHWSPQADRFWRNSIDSTLLIYDKETQFSTPEQFACHPVFDQEKGALIAFVCVSIKPSYELSLFMEDFFDQYFKTEQLDRKDGIKKEFLNIRIRDESGKHLYRSSILASNKMEAKVSIGQISSYLGLYQVELGFIGKDADGVATSLYQKNLWILGGVFGVLLLLMGALYYTSLKSQKLDRLKSEFLANMGHELKTPLTAIKLANETLRLGRVQNPEQATLSTDIIHKEATKLERIVRNLMEYSRMELEERRYKKEVVEVKDWWRLWLAHSQEKLSRQGFTLSTNSEEVSATIFMDKAAIEEVLDILLDNAVKYSPETKDLRIRLKEEAEILEIEVEDQGIGIPTDRQHDIFEKFVRLGNIDIHDVKGYGLGLSIAKAIVEAHEGRIEVESTLGKGSVFSVFLPKSSNKNR